MQDPITVRTTKVETYLRVSSASNVGKCLLIRLNYMVAHSLCDCSKLTRNYSWKLLDAWELLKARGFAMIGSGKICTPRQFV